MIRMEDFTVCETTERLMTSSRFHASMRTQNSDRYDSWGNSVVYKRLAASANNELREVL